MMPNEIDDGAGLVRDPDPGDTEALERALGLRGDGRGLDESNGTIAGEDATVAGARRFEPPDDEADEADDEFDYDEDDSFDEGEDEGDEWGPGGDAWEGGFADNH